MGLGNWKYTSHVPSVDETPQTDEWPADYVLRLAEAKARAASSLAQAEQYVVAADTVVVDGNRLLGKPADASDAIHMLQRLRGHPHKVFTGIAVLNLANANMHTDLCETEVPMRNYSDAEIEEYVRSGDPLDKAGAYAIQHPGFRPVEKLSGCYASVMGLPLCHLLRQLERLGAAPQPDLPAHCQNHLNYACPVSTAILRGEQVG